VTWNTLSAGQGPVASVHGGQGSLPLKTRSFLDFCVPRLRGPPGPRSQLFVSAIQSTSMSNGPVHSGTQKKIRAGGLVGKKRL